MSHRLASTANYCTVSPHPLSCLRLVRDIRRRLRRGSSCAKEKKRFRANEKPTSFANGEPHRAKWDDRSGQSIRRVITRSNPTDHAHGLVVLQGACSCAVGHHLAAETGQQCAVADRPLARPIATRVVSGDPPAGSASEWHDVVVRRYSASRKEKAMGDVCSQDRIYTASALTNADSSRNHRRAYLGKRAPLTAPNSAQSKCP